MLGQSASFPVVTNNHSDSFSAQSERYWKNVVWEAQHVHPLCKQLYQSQPPRSKGEEWRAQARPFTMREEPKAKRSHVPLT